MQNNSTSIPMHMLFDDNLHFSWVFSSFVHGFYLSQHTLTYTAEILLSCVTVPMCASMHLRESAVGYVVCFSDILNSKFSVLTANKFVMG